MSISVVIPVYNRGADFQNTLDSILAQTLAPLEIIVVDDGSTDNTPDWIEAHYGARVRLIRQTNGGVSSARNRGLELAGGEYIAFCDHDDVWLPSKLEQQMAKMKTDEDLGVVYCYWKEFDSDKEVAITSSLRPTQIISALEETNVEAELTKNNVIISMSVPLIKTSLLRRVGGFDSRMMPCDDWDVWLKCSALKRFGCVPQILVRYNRHDNQQSKNEIAMWNATRRVMLKHWKRACRHPRDFWVGLTRSEFLKTREPFYEQAQNAIFRADWKTLSGVLARCFLHHPFIFLTPQWIYVLTRLIKRDSRPF